MTDFSLRNSIRFCKQVTCGAHSSFVPAFALLPREKRQAMEILYAYTRLTDDLVDTPDASVTSEEKRRKINLWAGALEAVLGVIGGEAPWVSGPEDEATFRELDEHFAGCPGLEIMPALRMIVDRFNIPREPLFHLIDGVESDIEPQTFQVFEDSAEYCHQVATSVGFAALAIWGTTQPLFSDAVVRPAKSCGIAFQWTNILRDLLEDFQNGRIYLPQNELQRVNLTPNQFGSLLDRKAWNEQKKPPKDKAAFDAYAHGDMIRQMEAFEDRFDRLLQSQFQRCEIYYTSAAPLYSLIHRDARRVFGMMWSRYRMLFKKIQRHPLLLTRGRVRLSPLQKLRIFLRWKFLPPRRLAAVNPPY